MKSEVSSEIISTIIFCIASKQHKFSQIPDQDCLDESQINDLQKINEIIFEILNLPIKIKSNSMIINLIFHPSLNFSLQSDEHQYLILKDLLNYIIYFCDNNHL